MILLRSIARSTCGGVFTNATIRIKQLPPSSSFQLVNDQKKRFLFIKQMLKNVLDKNYKSDEERYQGDANQPHDQYGKPDVTQPMKGTIIQAPSTSVQAQQVQQAQQNQGQGQSAGAAAKTVSTPGTTLVPTFDPEKGGWLLYQGNFSKGLSSFKRFAVSLYAFYQVSIPIGMYGAYLANHDLAKILAVGGVGTVVIASCTYAILKVSSTYVDEIYISPNPNCSHANRTGLQGGRNYAPTNSPSNAVAATIESRLKAVEKMPLWLFPHQTDTLTIITNGFGPFGVRSQKKYVMPVGQLELTCASPGASGNFITGNSTYRWNSNAPTGKNAKDPAPAKWIHFHIHPAKTHILPLQPLHEFLIKQLKIRPFSHATSAKPVVESIEANVNGKIPLPLATKSVERQETSA